MLFYSEGESEAINPATGKKWRTKSEYPYSYDPFPTWASDKKKYGEQSCVYSDHLLSWDADKHDTLCQKHFGNKGQRWDVTVRHPKSIEAFLREYYDAPLLHLQEVWEGCNISNGYQIWHFFFIAKPQSR